MFLVTRVGELMSVNQVVFLKVETFKHVDIRRVITDITLPGDDVIPFSVVQIKTVDFSDKAVQDCMAVGNHFHTVESNRWELFVAVGSQDTPLFKFRYREAGDGRIREVEMKAGDACIIPPGFSHAFVGLASGDLLLGISNMKYDLAHDTFDKLL